mgnify:CR=1 FL=1
MGVLEVQGPQRGRKRGSSAASDGDKREGYGHPTWKQGSWQGELAIHGETYDPDTVDLAAPENFHVQQVVTVTDGERTGIGVLEHVVFGPYEPSGLTGMFDGALESGS